MTKHITPLPISEETLGAYIEGNLSQSEMSRIEELIQNNEEFSAFVDEVSSVDTPTDDSIYDEMPNFGLDFELPEIPSIENGLSFDSINTAPCCIQDTLEIQLDMEYAKCDDISDDNNITTMDADETIIDNNHDNGSTTDFFDNDL